MGHLKPPFYSFEAAKQTRERLKIIFETTHSPVHEFRSSFSLFENNHRNAPRVAFQLPRLMLIRRLEL